MNHTMQELLHNATPAHMVVWAGNAATWLLYHDRTISPKYAGTKFPYEYGEEFKAEFSYYLLGKVGEWLWVLRTPVIGEDSDGFLIQNRSLVSAFVKKRTINGVWFIMPHDVMGYKFGYPSLELAREIP